MPFAISTTITPGPNNIMVTASSVNFGYKKTIPHILGIAIGLSIMITTVGLGLANIFERYPLSHTVIKYIGSIYLLYLAWKIALFNRYKYCNNNKTKPFSLLQAALFQWVNPKAWLMSISAISTFTTKKGNVYNEVLVISIIFFLVCIPCVSTWGIIGSRIKSAFNKKIYLQIFNISMALLLLTSLISFLF